MLMPVVIAHIPQITEGGALEIRITYAIYFRSNKTTIRDTIQVERCTKEKYLSSFEEFQFKHQIVTSIDRSII